MHMSGGFHKLAVRGACFALGHPYIVASKELGMLWVAKSWRANKILVCNSSPTAVVGSKNGKKGFLDQTLVPM